MVRYDGKPLSDVGVEIGDGVTPAKENAIKRYKTDNHGIPRLPISRRGLQLIAVDYDVPSATPAITMQDAYTATLVFTSKP